MEISTLRRNLTVGFMDFLSIEQRTALIDSDLSLEKIVDRYPEINQKSVEECIKWSNEDQLNKIWWNWEPMFPNFDGIDRRIPYMLFVHGEIPKVKTRSVAIVGTRHTDNQGLQHAYKLGLEASANKISVVSGMAIGSDQAALQGAVDGEFPSFSVLGSGFGIDYPSYSEGLKRAIVESGGALITRFPPYTPPLKYNFPNRNTIIAAMGQLTVVVQAPKHSGSLITADFSLQLGKDVCVSRSGIGDRWGRAGTTNLAEQGALIINSISDVYHCSLVAKETKYADELTKRFGNKLYILSKL